MQRYRVWLIAELALGVVVGLFVGWVVAPVKWRDAAPALLRADYRYRYVQGVAEDYAAGVLDLEGVRAALGTDCSAAPWDSGDGFLQDLDVLLHDSEADDDRALGRLRFAVGSGLVAPNRESRQLGMRFLWQVPVLIVLLAVGVLPIVVERPDHDQQKMPGYRGGEQQPLTFVAGESGYRFAYESGDRFFEQVYTLPGTVSGEVGVRLMRGPEQAPIAFRFWLSDGSGSERVVTFTAASVLSRPDVEAWAAAQSLLVEGVSAVQEGRVFSLIVGHHRCRLRVKITGSEDGSLGRAFFDLSICGDERSAS